METPKVLYHYTTLNTLALILKSRSISFSRADKVNDKREGLSSDVGSFAHYLFLSCWTETSEENLALWNMYTPKMRGVRIELPMPIFEIYKIDDVYQSVIPASQIIDKIKSVFILPHREFIYKIKYTDDEELLKPKILATVGGYHGFKLTEIGIYKKKLWEFENEWRFRLNIFPLDQSKKSDFFPDQFNDLIDAKVAPSISNYLVRINQESFNNMKIRVGPRRELGDMELVEALIRTYNSKAKIDVSTLEHEIR